MPPLAVPKGTTFTTKPCALCRREVRALRWGGVGRHKCPLPGVEAYGFRRAAGERCGHQQPACERTTDGRCAACGQKLGADDAVPPDLGQREV